MYPSEKNKLVRVPLEEIEIATDHFRAKSVGEGGFGKVYKAKLPSFPDQYMVAIKRLNPQGRQGVGQFQNEIELLSCFEHPNLISLLGFCDERSEKVLVYEFASKGSLEDHFKPTCGLTWMCRLQICLAAARGLAYLHNGVGDQQRIIHRDIKCANILLDHNMQAKIADFGLSKAASANRPVSYLVSGKVAGTQGYVDPQYVKTGVLKKESDVYSFGVVLLEVFCGELTHDPKRANDEELASVARKWFKLGKRNKILDPELEGRITENYSISNDGINKESVDAFSAIMERCLNEKQVERPTMSQVVNELHRALRHQVKRLEDLKIPLADILLATNDFHPSSLILKQPYLGSSYKGVVTCYMGRTTVTIMRYTTEKFYKGKDMFWSEINFLTTYMHESIISLIGFCDEEDENIIVYEHASRGALERNININDDIVGLTLMQRLKICMGAACGLDYLQNDLQILHTDVKPRNILLNENWDAKISGLLRTVDMKKTPVPTFYSFTMYTPIYIDPHLWETNKLTKNSDVYSFGMVLFDVLRGKGVMRPPNDNLTPSVMRGAFERNSLEEIIHPSILKEIGPKALKTFSKIAYQCSEYHPEERPTISLVVRKLEKVLKLQENYEWKAKLPNDYKEIIKMAKSSVVYSSKKELYYVLYSGILLKNGNWFSLNELGENCEMVPATRFTYQNHKSAKRKAIHKSRLPKVAKMLDLSNLNLYVNMKTEFLSPGNTYAACLVFKFCDRKKIVNRPMYVALKYRFGIQADTSTAYFAETGNNGWMKIHLGHVSIKEANADFGVLLVSMSHGYCGSGAIYIEGIELLPIGNGGIEATNKIEDRHDVSRSDINWQRLPDEEKFVFLRKFDEKKCHMLRARKVLGDTSDKKRFRWICCPQSRFEDCVEILSYHEVRLRCNIETEMLSQDTVYACYFVYKISEKCRGLRCPVKAKNLLRTKRKTKENTYVYLRSPSPVNLLRGISHYVPREDGCMEVIVWEFYSKLAHHRHHIPLDIKLISLEGNMSGLIFCGIEFRPK